jgi:hypothetical protein
VNIIAMEKEQIEYKGCLGQNHYSLSYGEAKPYLDINFINGNHSSDYSVTIHQSNDT